MVDLRLRKKDLVKAVDPVGAGFVDRRQLSSGRFHACRGVVSNGCCDVSALRGAAFKFWAAPLPPPKPAIACTSWET
jgi:hypothetical protein